jgi:glycosyltransferase involved in cell wall biosynthesis
MAGVKTHVINLLKSIDVARFDVTYYYSMHRHDDVYAAELAALRARGIACVELAMDDGLRVRDNVRPFVELIRQLRAKRPAVLHLHSSKAGGLGRLASVFVHPRPAVLYTPNVMAAYRSRAFLWIERALGLLTDTLIAASPSEKGDFERWRIPGASRAAVITLGVPPLAAPPVAARPDRPWTIGACGRICYQKNPRLFFEVALAWIAEDPSCTFRWIGDFGDDDEAGAARALLERAGHPPQIEITGWVADPARELAALDAFCMFSRYESFGYVTAEAMQLGVPVVATPTTGTIDLVHHERTGLLAEANVPAMLAALRRLRDDRALRDGVIANARRQVADEHGVTNMIAKIEELYARMARD